MVKRICGSLNITTVLRWSFDYLVQTSFPLDRLLLLLYEQDLGVIHTIALATASTSRRLSTVTPLTPEVRAAMDNPDMPHIRIINRSKDDPINNQLTTSLDLSDASIIFMRLIIEKKRLGTLALVAKGPDRYTQQHMRWLAPLNEAFAVALSNTLEHEETLRLKELLREENLYLQKDLLNLCPDEIIGADFGLKNVMDMISVIAPLESPVLLLGETGVGKGVMAGAIHNLSPRRKGPFIAVNSGAIPDTLIDSELFGYERGAFTGAVEQKYGRFERADQGTIFLDEIGDLPAHAQTRLLRVLEDKTIERVGGSKSISVNIRVIAATHRNLEEMVRKGLFREDLWFRINMFPIHIPPLRERKVDIPAFVNNFIDIKVQQLKLSKKPELAPGVIDRLMNYEWPGNVRELENVVEREMILNREAPLQFRFLDRSRRDGTTSEHFRKAPEGMQGLEQMTGDYIRRALQMTNGVIHGPEGAAALLKINPSTLRSRLKKLGIPYGRRVRNLSKPENKKAGAGRKG
ncbi:MAG: sigma 54-interacting transcriptional regulator [Syntrophales bacterium]|nr:sigma 54-interacting transcriptional regulator [Syntrophales bacterium]MCK9527634.1 sigma 54-interacting transcriptional regulator [Syntrophales bacterium]